jgi:hypothetical protein
MKKLILISVLFAAACSKSKDNTPSVTLVGTWKADNTNDFIAQWEFTGDGKYYTRLKNGQYEIAPKDSGRYKYDGVNLTTTFIDTYINGTAIIAYDTTRCQVSGNKLELRNNSAVGYYTRQN